MKPDATIFVIGSYHNIFRVGSILQDLGFWILNDIVWRKANPMPNFRGRRFTNAHETMIWASRSAEAKAYTFNYEALKAGNEDRQMRSDWFFPICTGAERLKDENGRKTHPTQKPEALLARILMAASKPGDVVLDPFFGTGTTGAVAKKLGRHFIGCERDESYISAARAADRGGRTVAGRSIPVAARQKAGGARRLRHPDRSRDDRAGNDSVTKSAAISRGARRRRIALGQIIGSIHKIGALTQGLPACNGWTYWRVEQDGRSISIDDLRTSYRASVKGDDEA